MDIGFPEQIQTSVTLEVCLIVKNRNGFFNVPENSVIPLRGTSISLCTTNVPQKLREEL